MELKRTKFNLLLRVAEILVMSGIAIAWISLIPHPKTSNIPSLKP